ncbi:hypothetical protein LPB41_19865 [Thalassospira sp. MA62]|nr:hypothetical protein [Thalassospira sp. MA62]
MGISHVPKRSVTSNSPFNITGGMMGSLFATPRPAARSAPAPSTRQNNTAAEPTAAEVASDARKEALERRRYGRGSLIGTSYRGVLTDRINQAAGGKNLLGD